MGYLHIDNLYKNQDVLLFKECYAMEKVHGTSAHISFKYDNDNTKINFYAGGAKHQSFVNLFDEEKLLCRFMENFSHNVTIYGEAYGGKLQGMKDTYGEEMKFIVFDVMINDVWLDVPNAEKVAKLFDLEFVPYEKCKSTIKELDLQKGLRSIVAERNGIKDMKMREGVVIRPLIELRKNNGNRIIAKHKNKEFIETKTTRVVDKKQLKILTEAKEIAEEWVTLMRLKHILGNMKEEDIKIENLGTIIKIMIDDIYREGKNEIIENKDVSKAISKKTANLFKTYYIKNDKNKQTNRR